MLRDPLTAGVQHRPFTIWVITVVDFAVAFLLVAMLVNRFGPSGGEPVSGNPWLLEVILITFLATCYAAWAGRKWGRNLLLTWLTLASIIFLYGTFTDVLRPEFERASSFRSAVWTEVRGLAVFGVWCSLHGVMMFGKRERAFYNSRSGVMTMGRSFWRFLEISAPAVLFAGASFAFLFVHSSLAWNDVDHAHRECVTVSEIAGLIAAMRREEYPNRTVEFSTVIAGSPFRAWPPHFETPVTFGPINCFGELGSRNVGLAYMRFPRFVEAIPLSYDRYSFSRVSFWNGGDTAILVVTVWCGNLCGTGSETVWQRQNG